MTKIRTGLALLGLAVLTVLALELGVRLAFYVAGDLLELGQGLAKSGKPAFALVSYDAERLLREQKDARGTLYEPYAVWRARPYSGSLFRVDDGGLRVTQHSSGEGGALEIWMFGGSTMFGSGAPDGETIPSHLAWILNREAGRPARVSNFGQPGYVTTQEVVALIRELQERPAPDVVIFYDGFNDMVSARNWPGTPGAHFQLDRIRNRFESAVMPLVFSSGLYRGVEYAVRRWLRIRAAPAPGPAAPPPAEQAARIWLRNVELVSALAGDLGFVHLALFQPALALEAKPLHPSESEILPGGASPLVEMRQVIRAHLEREGPGPVHDLSEVFAGVTEPVYYDSAHLTGRGNRIVAERIAELVERGLDDRPGPPGARRTAGTVEPESPPPP